MRLIEINRDPTRSQLRGFGAIWFPLFCGVVALIVWRAADSEISWYVGGGASGLSLLFAFAAPKALKPVFLTLIVLSFPIGWVVSHLLMGLVYYVVLTPVGLGLRLLGVDPLNRRFNRDDITYWEELPPPPPKERYFRQF